jgi:hypothetical protein
MSNVYQISVGKPWIAMGRRRSRWMNIMDVRKTVWEGVDWIHLALDRVQWRGFVNTVMNLAVPKKGVEFLDCEVISFSRTLPHAVRS